MTRVTTNLGGTAPNIVAGKVAHGLLSMTWKQNPVPDEECFEAIKAGIDALPSHAKIFLDGGGFYGHNAAPTNLEMIARFFEKYPEYVDRTFLSIKSREYYSKCQYVNEKLRGTKRLELFQCARVDPDVDIEVSIATLAELKSEGKLDHIGMSECSAETLRRGRKVHPISIVEIEVSPLAYEPEARKVIAVAKELGIAVAAYSPLGRGFLTGQIKRPEDLPLGDMRRHMPRFEEDNLRHNFAIVDAVAALAKKKNVTPAQLCIAWVGSLGPHVIPLPGSSHVKRTLENVVGGDIVLNETEIQEVNILIENADVKGLRYSEQATKYLWA